MVHHCGIGDGAMERAPLAYCVSGAARKNGMVLGAACQPVSKLVSNQVSEEGIR